MLQLRADERCVATIVTYCCRTSRLLYHCQVQVVRRFVCVFVLDAEYLPFLFRDVTGRVWSLEQVSRRLAGVKQKYRTKLGFVCDIFVYINIILYVELCILFKV